ncbi:hypothetical protein, partial [Brevibacillus agri]|uniref:hypothetical protein n=1 Tax=Brevibacillus agri TaxID=51101 RepID=UPI0028682901
SVNQPYKKVKNYARGRSSTFNGEELNNSEFGILRRGFCEHCHCDSHFYRRSHPINRSTAKSLCLISERSAMQGAVPLSFSMT